jgi:hypothetical protein
MSDLFQNKVAASGLITLDLETYKPEGEIVEFDIKEFLFMGLILKEKDFREALKQQDWSAYSNKNVAIMCSADAIIPVWAYMLIVSYLQPVVANVFLGSKEEMKKHLFITQLNTIDAEAFRDQRIVIKGCGDEPVGDYAYAEITRILLPVAKSIMYGEPCSTVPVFKRK